jgi:hypothetical protein
MKKAIAALILLVAFQSCKDDNELPTSSSSSINLVTTSGSYWVYDWFEIDSNGVETKKGMRDSIFISGDTLINSKTYIKYDGVQFDKFNNRLLRDSAGFIVNQNGLVLWGTTVSQLSEHSTVDFTVTSKMTSLNESISVPAGTFNTVLKTNTACYDDGRPFTKCSQCWDSKSYYKPGLGVIAAQTAYIGTINNECKYLEKRLVEYNIE